MSDHDVLVSVKTVLDEVRDRLFGDGVTGELPQLKTRTTNLEEFKNRLIGALVLLGGLTSIIGGTLIYHLFTGK